MIATEFTGPGPMARFGDDVGRWSTAGLAVLTAHILLAHALSTPHEPPELPGEPPAAVMIDMEAVAPSEAAPSTLSPAAERVASVDTAPPVPAEPIPPEQRMEELAPAEPPDTAQPVEAEQLPETLQATRDTPQAVEPPEAAQSAALQPVEPAQPPPPAMAAPTEAAPAQPEPTPPTEAAPEATEMARLDAAEVEPQEAAPVEPAETVPEPEAIEPLRPAEATAEPVEQAEEAVEELTGEVIVAARLPRPRPDVAPPVRLARATPRRETPPERPARKKPAPPSAASAPAAEPQQAAAHAAPRAGATAARPSVSPDRWRSAVVRHLERRKRYPREAEQDGIGGTVRVRFTIDAGGNILRHRITASSGHAELDQAVTEMIRRSSPIPAPPREAFRPGLSLEVPIRFAAR
jgi:protein TonB